MQIWSECKPFGGEIRASETVTWTPSPLSSSDISIMDMATQKYDEKGSIMNNHCRLSLQVISIFDLLTYDLLRIHPS